MNIEALQGNIERPDTDYRYMLTQVRNDFSPEARALLPQNTAGFMVQWVGDTRSSVRGFLIGGTWRVPYETRNSDHRLEGVSAFNEGFGYWTINYSTDMKVARYFDEYENYEIQQFDGKNGVAHVEIGHSFYLGSLSVEGDSITVQGSLVHVPDITNKLQTVLTRAAEAVTLGNNVVNVMKSQAA